MSHTAKITERDRALFILMIDQSGSMSEPYGRDTMRTKAEVVAEVCNTSLTELVSRCRDGVSWKHYFDIGVIGYSGRGVYSLLPSGAWLLSPAQMASSAKTAKSIRKNHRTPDGSIITLHSSYKVWIEPIADGKTPMYGAFSKLLEVVLSWRAAQPSLHVFPPVVINITDGEPTDASMGSLREITERIRAQGTADGEPIIFNIHISSQSDQSITMPEKLTELPTEAELLFHLSSLLPDSFKSEITSKQNSRPVRAMAYNAGIDELIRMINIGSTTITSQR